MYISLFTKNHVLSSDPWSNEDVWKADQLSFPFDRDLSLTSLKPISSTLCPFKFRGIWLSSTLIFVWINGSNNESWDNCRLYRLSLTLTFV